MAEPEQSGQRFAVRANRRRQHRLPIHRLRDTGPARGNSQRVRVGRDFHRRPTSPARCWRRCRLNELDVSTTLVATLEKGVNDDEIGQIIDYGLSQACVRGVTLQPVQDAGRVQGYDPRLNRLTVSEQRRRAEAG